MFVFVEMVNFWMYVWINICLWMIFICFCVYLCLCLISVLS
jgi:hypothetical protein